MKILIDFFELFIYIFFKVSQLFVKFKKILKERINKIILLFIVS